MKDLQIGVADHVQQHAPAVASGPFLLSFAYSRAKYSEPKKNGSCSLKMNSSPSKNRKSTPYLLFSVRHVVGKLHQDRHAAGIVVGPDELALRVYRIVHRKWQRVVMGAKQDAIGGFRVPTHQDVRHRHPGTVLRMRARETAGTPPGRRASENARSAAFAGPSCRPSRSGAARSRRVASDTCTPGRRRRGCRRVSAWRRPGRRRLPGRGRQNSTHAPAANPPATAATAAMRARCGKDGDGVRSGSVSWLPLSAVHRSATQAETYWRRVIPSCPKPLHRVFYRPVNRERSYYAGGPRPRGVSQGGGSMIDVRRDPRPSRDHRGPVARARDRQSLTRGFCTSSVFSTSRTSAFGIRRTLPAARTSATPTWPA